MAKHSIRGPDAFRSWAATWVESRGAPIRATGHDVCTGTAVGRDAVHRSTHTERFSYVKQSIGFGAPAAIGGSFGAVCAGTARWR